MSAEAVRGEEVLAKERASMVERAESTAESGPGLSSWQVVVKRAIDVALSALVLVALIPLWVLVAVLIKLDSRSPVLYAQKRVGKDGSLFTIYKFRSMYKDADKMRVSLDGLNEASGPVFKIRRDPRITRVGSLLRRSSIDEFPQLLNVLRGDMSLVGPRPPLPAEVEKYNEYQMQRLAVRPGITGLWQVQGRSTIPFDEWVKLDLQYIANQSVWLDCKILLKTIPAVLKGSGAW